MVIQHVRTAVAIGQVTNSLKLFLGDFQVSPAIAFSVRFLSTFGGNLIVPFGFTSPCDISRSQEGLILSDSTYATCVCMSSHLCWSADSRISPERSKPRTESTFSLMDTKSSGSVIKREDWNSIALPGTQIRMSVPMVRIYTNKSHCLRPGCDGEIQVKVEPAR
ncbi:hypothetical protein K432DRAFT_102153 [Lepidopterella palustris CBS 459.81]|uniref:Uncharacterized protein n=1 Tax=Lepidopterella palustris CBS 459.81 TaxID=1314670 RepID=A0A8E2JJ89_9PEZI|nr:hypothetical protein K432DRAFT_102153 [Lepidopterella palustris CBS 459.81]